MSRDFLVVCNDKAEAAAASILDTTRAEDGEALFEADRRENDLFVMLIYSHDIQIGFRVRIGEREYAGFGQEVVFVAIKNAHHHNVG